MAHTDVTTVRQQWTDLDDDFPNETLDTFIDWANIVVTRELASEVTDDTLLTAIETFLTIHLAKTNQPGVAKVNTGDTSITLEGASGELGLRETREGRRAMFMDPTGNLEATDSGSASLLNPGPTYDDPY
jgi:hypothetical protein